MRCQLSCESIQFWMLVYGLMQMRSSKNVNGFCSRKLFSHEVRMSSCAEAACGYEIPTRMLQNGTKTKKLSLTTYAHLELCRCLRQRSFRWSEDSNTSSDSCLFVVDENTPSMMLQATRQILFEDINLVFEFRSRKQRVLWTEMRSSKVVGNFMRLVQKDAVWWDKTGRSI